MSLCVAWIREDGGSQELVFVTDSTLTCGEKWNHGIKLFEIPQTNCLLSFVGVTQRAYTLILNLMSSISVDGILSSQITIEDILEHVVKLFTTLILEIHLDEGHHSANPQEDLHNLRDEAKFLFGGWDWEKNIFRLWRIEYSKETESMLYEELAGDRGTRNFVEYIGDAYHPDIETKAQEDFEKLMDCQGHGLDCALNMEPAKILLEIVRDTSIREIGGSLQIAKLHQSNKIDFYGIYWPSENGHPHFQGREYTPINKPNVKYYDPDTFEILEMDIPVCLDAISEDKFGVDTEFMQACYPEGNLKEHISEKEKEKIQRLLKEVAYQSFLEQMECHEPSIEGETDG